MYLSIYISLSVYPSICLFFLATCTRRYNRIKVTEQTLNYPQVREAHLDRTGNIPTNHGRLAEACAGEQSNQEVNCLFLPADGEAQLSTGK